MSESAVTLRELRLAAGLSQDDLAERMDTSAVYISQVETGARRASPRWLERYANATGASVLATLRAAGLVEPSAVDESDLAAIVAAHPELGDVFAFARQHPEILPQLVTYGKFLIQELGEDEPGSAAATGDTA